MFFLSGDSRESYHNVTVAVFSRYYLRCPVESHYATYKWFHNDNCVQTCNTTHHPCIHFIENVTQDQYGCYICVSEEGGYTQTLVKECMVKQPEFMRLQWNRATTTSCCSLMLLMVFVLLFLRDWAVSSPTRDDSLLELLLSSLTSVLQFTCNRDALLSLVALWTLILVLFSPFQWRLNVVALLP